MCLYKTFLMLFSSCVLAACTTVKLEYDRMTGTDFPQPETVAGEEVTLQTIYLQGDIVLVEEPDDTNIAPLTGEYDSDDPNQYDYITTAEIDTLVLANRSSIIGVSPEYSCGVGGTCRDYHLYGIVLAHYQEKNDGTRRTGAMGLMYDSGDRSGFVNYYLNATISGNNAKYLRSAAHEIGHAFNLNHCDGDGSSTIMNQTSVVGNTFSYEFSSSSLDHLQNHDEDHVWPGISSRDYVCPHVH